MTRYPLFAAALALTAFVTLVATPRAAPVASAASPITRAIEYLSSQQLRQPLDLVLNGSRVLDFPGNYPQYFQLQQAEWLRVRDVSPFTVAFIHHALTHITEKNRGALRLSRSEIDTARSMRRRAVGFMKMFESPSGAPDAGTFGFWPYDFDPNFPDPWTSFVLTLWLQGPILGGNRVPANLSVFPSTLAIPTDADVTATTYTALLDDEMLDGGVRPAVAVDRFFTDWRDVGLVPRRVNPPWLPPASGAYLTWLTYRDPPFPPFPNDVDLVVNGNVLYALARHGRLTAAGVGNAIDLIDLVTMNGIHRDRLEEITEYYPDNLAFQYVVSRAFREGPVPALAGSVTILADELEQSAQLRQDGAAYWDLGDPQLNTAFAVLTLLNAGRRTPLVEMATKYLVSAQNATGGYDEATFFIGRTDGGQVFEFTSASFTTAMVLEALARYELSRCQAHATGAPDCR
jgi:hypothetical protein